MSGPLWVQVRKEFRELLPWWGATLVVVFSFAGPGGHLSPRLGGPGFLALGLLLSGAGMIAVGALSIGNEYAHRTLGPLLALPIDRRRVLAIKFAVLTLLVAVLMFVTWFGLSRADYHIASAQAVTVAAALVAIFIAPWLTMVCRGPLAGSIFAGAIPVALQAADNATWREFGDLHLMWPGMALVSAIGAVLTWRTFLRLEAIDGPHADIDAPAWLRRHVAIERMPTESRGRVWQLVLKELHLQQMTLVVSGLYAVVWIGFAAARSVAVGFWTIAILHGGLVAVMSGALASAEERRLGSADWQTLLPVSAWKQWMIKAGVAIGLALVLAVGVSALLGSGQPWADLSFHKELAYAVVMLCVGSLYVSSFSSSGMRALLASLPVIAGAALLTSSLQRPIVFVGQQLFRPLATAAAPWIDVLLYGQVLSGMVWILAVGLAALLLRFGYTNHRWADRGRVRIQRQVLLIAGYVFAVLLVFAFVLAMQSAAISAQLPRT